MPFSRTLRKIAGALALVVAVVFSQTFALAGTTGTFSGTVTDAATRQPLAGAKVTVTSPSQSATVRTDGSGHFVFLALAPDTYAVSVDLAGYAPISVSGETIIADATRTLAIAANKALQT